MGEMTNSFDLTTEFNNIQNYEDSDLKLHSRKFTEVSTCSKFNDLSTE